VTGRTGLGGGDLEHGDRLGHRRDHPVNGLADPLLG
jgi:hypothetical protein